MKRFRVIATYIQSAEAEVLAADEAEAYRIARELDGSNFEALPSDDWKIEAVEELPDNLKPAELAFIEAYGTACAAENSDTVRAFFLLYDDADAFCDKYGTGAYSSIMDAFQVWQLAISYQRGIEKIN
jgi:hypothetical protein